jgi:hypothetical protein
LFELLQAGGEIRWDEWLFFDILGRRDATGDCLFEFVFFVDHVDEEAGG